MPQTRYTGPELCALSAREAVKLLKRKEVSPAEMLDAAFERVTLTLVDPATNEPIQFIRYRLAPP